MSGASEDHWLTDEDRREIWELYEHQREGKLPGDQRTKEGKQPNSTSPDPSGWESIQESN